MTMECLPPPSATVLFFDGPLSSLVILIGVVGNMYCLKVLFARSVNMAMLVSMTGLAIWDMVLLVAAFCHHSIWASMHYFKYTDEPWEEQMVALNGIVECGHITSTWMLIEVTAERFFAVTRPFVQFVPIHRKQRRKNYARMVAGVIRLPLIMTAVAFIITLPCSFEFHLETCQYKNAEYYQRQETALMKNFYYKLFYRTIFISVTKTFGPFMVITLLTISTLRSMRQSMNSRATILIQQGQNHLFQADRDKTRSLQTISMLLLGKFLLLRCWPTALAVAQMFFGETQLNPLPVDLSHFFLLLNSATNSFIFVVLKRAFETRRLKRIRMRQRELVAKHAEQVLSIGKALAGDKLLLLQDIEHIDSEDSFLEMTPIFQANPSLMRPLLSPHFNTTTQP